MTTTTVKLTDVELETDYTYDVSHEQAQAELDRFLGKALDVSDFLREGDDPTNNDVVFTALQDKLTDLTGLLVAFVGFERFV